MQKCSLPLLPADTCHPYSTLVNTGLVILLGQDIAQLKENIFFNYLIHIYVEDIIIIYINIYQLLQNIVLSVWGWLREQYCLLLGMFSLRGCKRGSLVMHSYLFTIRQLMTRLGARSKHQLSTRSGGKHRMTRLKQWYPKYNRLTGNVENVVHKRQVLEDIR